jgi:8-oxo-dGTP pyrophosphatase MutT (NUDIX family)
VSTADITSIKAKLQKALSNTLPGEEAHLEMIPNGRSTSSNSSLKPTKQSSVLLLLFKDGDTLSTCFIKRPSAMRNHGGQMAFPGGRFEQQDTDLIHTALRETKEEVGIEESSIEILGALTPVGVEVSNFTIFPFIGWCI